VAGCEFAGWIGCKHVIATTCEVNVIAATEVTAVFLKQGKQVPAARRVWPVATVPLAPRVTLVPRARSSS
jgi:hypothetical protein